MTIQARGLMALATMMTVVGCQDLDITNINNPDRDVALANPVDVEALISSSWRVYFTSIHNTLNINYMYPAMSTEVTSSSNERALFTQSAIPRIAFNNSPFATTLTDPIGVRDSWRAWHQVVSNSNEGLAQIARGMRMVEGNVDNTARARAFAKFNQGLAWGQLGMIFDRSTLVDETVAIPADPVALAELVRTNLKPYPDILAKVLQSFDEAVAIAQQNNVTIPPEWMHTTAPVTTAEFVRIVNTYAARHIVYSARTPQERAALDWDRVLAYTANGITRNFAPQMSSASGGLSSNLYFTAQRNVSACVTCFRASYFLIGPADVSGAYQEWLSKPLMTRSKFNIVTPDRRITGPLPTQRGAYFTHRPNNFGEGQGQGEYTMSSYQWFRAEGLNSNIPVNLITLAEKNLLRAEALIRKGGAANVAEAVNLINVSRTAEVTIPGIPGPLAGGRFAGLPPVTADGVPQSASCVPRTATGACGNLMDALLYERSIEAAVSDATRAYGDYRGFAGRLPSGTWLQLPVPGAELDMLGLEVYTFGGVGGEYAAP
jgi:starch-binding outer membrane protein, SusD/RagB family